MLGAPALRIQRRVIQKICVHPTIRDSIIFIVSRRAE
jgi:hypothetical protein